MKQFLSQRRNLYILLAIIILAGIMLWWLLRPAPVNFSSDPTKRLEQAEQILVKNHNDFNALFNKGLALFALGRYDEAVSAYQAAVHVNPNSYLAWNNLGNAQRDHNLFTDAITSYTKAIELNSKYVPAYANLADVYELLSAQDKSKLSLWEQTLLQGLKTNPGAIELLQPLIRYYQQVGDSTNVAKYQAELNAALNKK